MNDIETPRNVLFLMLAILGLVCFGELVKALADWIRFLRWRVQWRRQYDLGRTRFEGYQPQGNLRGPPPPGPTGVKRPKR
jgi:hypothetical protein